MEDSTSNLAKGLEGLKIFILILVASLLLTTSLVIFQAYKIKELVELVTGQKMQSIWAHLANNTYSYREYPNGEVVSYADLAKENDSLISINQKVTQDLEQTKFLLDFAVNTYDIKFKKISDNGIEKWRIESGRMSEILEHNSRTLDITEKSLKMLKKHEKELENKNVK